MLLAWIVECCTLGETERCHFSSILLSYLMWAERNEEKPVSRSEFKLELKMKRGCKVRNTLGGPWWYGISLNNVADDMQ